MISPADTASGVFDSGVDRTRATPGSPAESRLRRRWGPQADRSRASDRVGALIVRTARADVAAFELLYEAMAGAVFGLLLRVMRNRAIAEEVTREVLVDAWRYAERYRPERGSGRSWILSIAHRRAVDRIRDEQTAADREDAYCVQAWAPPGDDVAEIVELHVERDLVRQQLTVLTELQRERLGLAYGGHTDTEVARILGVPTGTIKTRIRDALNRLGDAMADDDAVDGHSTPASISSKARAARWRPGRRAVRAVGVGLTNRPTSTADMIRQT